VLHPGDVVCAERGDRLETLLGSCVAVVLSDPARTIGAMCHIVHSRASRRPVGPPTMAADAAIDRMYELLTQRGLNPRLCDAFVYGGGNMFPEHYSATHVGRNNAVCVLARLAADTVDVVIQDLGGPAYRRLAWTIGTGLPEVTAVGV
jgi:chemotaxis protein CheD